MRSAPGLDAGATTLAAPSRVVSPVAVRVLFVIDSAAIGGAERVILSFLRYLSAEPFECYVACPAEAPLLKEYRRFAAGVVPLGCNGFFNLRTILELAALIKRLKIDVVHTCLYTSDAAGIVAGRIAGARRIVSHVVGCNFLITNQRGICRAIKYVESRVHRAIYRFADRLIAVSDTVKADLVRRPGLRVPARKITVMRHTLARGEVPIAAEPVAEVRRRFLLDEGASVIAMIASFVPVKSHEDLVRAMRQVADAVPDIRCLLIGEGPSRPQMQALTQSLGLERHVVFTGALDESLKWAALQLSRVIVLPSLSEGRSVVLLEAMVCGTPVVVTNVAGNAEMVDDGVTGLLVPPRDPEALATAILRLLSDRALTERMGRSARQRFDQASSPGAMVDALRAVYSGVDVPPDAPYLAPQE